MPDTLITLVDLAKINDQNAVDLGVTDIFNAAPFLAALAATTATNGTTHTYLKESGAPVVGFRDVNEGRDRSRSQDTQVTVTLKVLDASFHVDKAIADAYTKGGPAAIMAREAKRHLRAALRAAEGQLFYGTDAKGFASIISVLSALAHPMVHNAAGGALNDRTSVYAVRTTSDETDVVMVMGQDGNIMVADYIQTVIDDATGKKFDAYAQSILGWLGLQIGGAQSMGRLCNIGGAQPLTDALMSRLFEKFPEEAPPTHFVMNKAAQGQLRRSRTATSATGAEAPYPEEWNGIPIITTSSISSNETAVA